MPPDVMVDASSKAVADQDDENRIAPAGFDVNGDETSVRRTMAVNIIDARQVMATPREKYQDLWPR